MKYKPRKNLDSFYLPIFIMDSLIIFLLAGLVAFMGPLFLGMFLSRKSKSHDNFMDNNIIPLYEKKDTLTVTLEIISMIIAAIILVASIFYRLYKWHIFAFIIENDQLLIEKVNLLKMRKIKKIPIKSLRLEKIKETANSEKSYKLYNVNKESPFFSTHSNKYWDPILDAKMLDNLFTELQNNQL